MRCLLASMLVATVLIGCTPENSAVGTSQEGQTAPNTAPNAAVQTKPSSDDSRVYRREELKTVTVKLKGKTFHLWVMDTDGKRQEGMMFLRDEDVRDDEGMLFAFPEVQQAGEANGFWMRNTYIPLDIIYISPQGKVVNVGKGEPFNETSVPPAGTYQNVIELKAGTAAKIGLKPGDPVALPKDLKPTSDAMPRDVASADLRLGVTT